MTTDERIADLNTRMLAIEKTPTDDWTYEQTEEYCTLWDEWYELVRNRDFKNNP